MRIFILGEAVFTLRQDRGVFSSPHRGFGNLMFVWQDPPSFAPKWRVFGHHSFCSTESIRWKLCCFEPKAWQSGVFSPVGWSGSHLVDPYCRLEKKGNLSSNQSLNYIIYQRGSRFLMMEGISSWAESMTVAINPLLWAINNFFNCVAIENFHHCYFDPYNYHHGHCCFHCHNNDNDGSNNNNNNNNNNDDDNNKNDHNDIEAVSIWPPFRRRYFGIHFVNNKSSDNVQIMAIRGTDNNSLPEPMMA